MVLTTYWMPSDCDALASRIVRLASTGDVDADADVTPMQMPTPILRMQMRCR